MTALILWIAFFGTALSWIWLWVLLVARLRRRWLRIVVTLFAEIVPTLLLGILVAAAWKLRLPEGGASDWRAYFSSLLLFFLVGSAVAIVFCFRRDRLSRHMPACIPAIGFPFFICVGGLAIQQAESAFQAKCGALQLEAQQAYIASRGQPPTKDANAGSLYEAAFENLQRRDVPKVENPPCGINTVFDPHEPATIEYLAEQTDTCGCCVKARVARIASSNAIAN